MNRNFALSVIALAFTVACGILGVSTTARCEDATTVEPTWLTQLFPDIAETDRVGRRLRRIEAREMKVQDSIAGAVTVTLTYPGIDGSEETGQARIFLPPTLRTNPRQRVPLIHNAGYEFRDTEAAGLLAQGFAVSTPHAHALNPLGRGVHLDRAILHAVRQLPWVDALQVSIQGGSAGGWMTLMVSADAFPLVWSMPMVPPVHLGYNIAYISDNEARAAAPAGSEEPRMPVLLAVTGIAHQTRELYGVPFDDPAYLAASPLAHLETVTAPTLVTFSTADMLVPINQVGATLVQDFDEAAFPPGFYTKMSDRFPGVNGARTLLTALTPDSHELFTLEPGPDPKRASLSNDADGTPTAAALPFSKSKTWSIVILDEGPVEPKVGHLKYVWALSHESFRAWAEQQGVTADQLTLPKLTRLMQRMLGQPWRPLQVRPKGKDELIQANLLDYPEAERADVVLGLKAFAENDARAARLAELYAQLPEPLQVLGSDLAGAAPERVRSILRAANKRE